MKHFIFAVVFLTSVQPAIAMDTAATLTQRAVTLDEKSNFSDDFFPEDQMEGFWKIHKRFGVTYLNGRHVLVAKDKDLLAQLITDLKNWKKSVGEVVGNEIPMKKVPGTNPKNAAADISDLLPSKVRNWILQDNSSSNCWGFASFVAGLMAGPTYVNNTYFHFLMQSGLVGQLDPQSEIPIGAILAFRDTGLDSFESEVHGAIYVSPRLVIQKYNSKEGFYRLQDLEETLIQYGPNYMKTMKFEGRKDAKVRIDVFTAKTLQSWVDANAAVIGSQTMSAYNEFVKLEWNQGLHSRNPPLVEYGALEVDEDVIQKGYDSQLDIFMTLNEKLGPLAAAEVTKRGKVQAGAPKPVVSDSASAEAFIWNLIHERLR